MLSLSENATSIVNTIDTRQSDSADAGLRISGPTDGAFSISAVPAGQPGDQVVTSGDAKVYLEESASQALDDKVLDAQVTADGDVQFQLAQQAG